MIQVKWKHWNGQWLIRNLRDDDAAMRFIWMCETCGYEYELVQDS